MMENLNGYSHDFLSNGIYQLYCNENDQDMAPDWSYYDSVGNGFTRIYDSAVIPSEEYDESKGYSIISEYIVPDVDVLTCQSIPAVNINASEITSDDCWQSSSGESNQENSIDDWDLSIENILLDLDLTSNDWTQQQMTLPDRTMFCSDSCDAFLRESSDGLTSYFSSETEFYDSDECLHLNEMTPDQSENWYTIASPPETTFPTVHPNTSSAQHQPPDPADNSDAITFPCTFNDCHKIYAKPAHLKAHLRRHVGEKPYVCTWSGCTWKFSRSDELSRHRRSHSGVKPYKCGYCTKCFARSDHLTKHRKVHERKMAKLNKGGGTIVWPHHQLPPGRPGRRPKAQITA